MQRREFMGSIAAGLAAAGLLPQITSATATDLEQLRRDISTPGSERTWPRIRKEFMLRPGLAHLNCGSLGACPRLVVDGVARFMRELELDPVHQNWGSLGRAAEVVRAHAAEFIGAAPDEVSITSSTTEGMNSVAAGLRLKTGDEVLTTNHEHAGGSSCWQYLAERDGIRIVQIQLPVPVQSADDVLALIDRHMTPRTRVCSFCHVDTITGMRMPIEEISELVRDRDVLLVCDGAQAPGMLDVDVKKLGVDAYASSSHKWMLAPKGGGLLYIRKEAQDRIRPIALRSGFGVYTGSTGTRNIPQILGHGLAMDFHNAIGRDQSEARCLELCAKLRESLGAIEWLESITPEAEILRSAMVSYKLSRGSNQILVNTLSTKHSIVVKSLPATLALNSDAKSENYNAIRFSTHVFNSEDEIARLVSVLQRL